MAGVGFAGGTGDVAAAAGGGSHLPRVVSVTSGGSNRRQETKRARGGDVGRKPREHHATPALPSLGSAGVAKWSVAPLEACLVRGLLERLAGNSDPIARLAPTFFVEVQTLIETPWSVATLDFVFPDTRGQRPADFEARLKFGIALTGLAAEDAAVHKLTVEVQYLLRPRSVYRDPALVQRVLAKRWSRREALPGA